MSCQHCGTSEDTDSKDTIHTAVSQKSDITHSGDMSLVNAQQSDRNIQKMRQWVEKGTKPSYDSKPTQRTMVASDDKFPAQ
jgi:hypothetical protein